MKICVDCGYQFETKSWQCTKCGYQPEMRKGFPIFAPQLNDTYGGFEARFFNKLVEVEKGNFWFESRNQLLIWALKSNFPKARNFLEIGCGTGFVLGGIRQEFPELQLYGCDMYIEGLAYANQRRPESTLFQMDARNIPYGNEFDVIGAFDVLEHINEDQEVLNQMNKAVRQGGGIILTVPQHPFLWSQTDEYAHHVRRYMAKELKVKVENAGFKVLRRTSFVSLLFPFMLISRLKERFSAAKTYDPYSEVEINHSINSIFRKILDFERLIVKLGLSFPIGGSILLVARKMSK